MSSGSPQYLIETDVLAEYLVTRVGNGYPEVSLLRAALRTANCYTTMLNAMELFRAAQSDYERSAILQVLHLVRVLGFSARYSQPFAELADSVSSIPDQPVSNRDALIVGMARISKLTIVTKTYYERYRPLAGVAVVNAVPSSGISAMSTHAENSLHYQA